MEIMEWGGTGKTHTEEEKAGKIFFYLRHNFKGNRSRFSDLVVQDLERSLTKPKKKHCFFIPRLEKGAEKGEPRPDLNIFRDSKGSAFFLASFLPFVDPTLFYEFILMWNTSLICSR